MRDTALVIMAAGIGSRFGGGIKQLEAVGPSGEIIMDYSIYDALEAGFNEIIFIIRRDLEKDFKEIIGNRIEKIARVKYAYQELDDLPAGFKKPEGRTKPWGTGQAILCVKDLIQTPFLVINADDYYGKSGFRMIHEYMVNEMDINNPIYDLCMGGFMLTNTLSENGGVTRGVCRVDDQGILLDVTETYDIRMNGTKIEAKTESGSLLTIDAGRPVSMNMWGLSPAFLEELERGFPEFLSSIPDGDLKAEYLLPHIIDTQIQDGRARVKVLETPDKWFGVTYKEDKPSVIKSIRDLVEQGVYKEKLF